MDNWRTDSRVNKSSALIGEACRELRHVGGISKTIWQRLLGGDFPTSALSDTAAMSKERRVEAFESFAHNLSGRPYDELVASFLIGFLANQVSGGSLEHANLIFAIQDRFPSAMLWYGVCAGLVPGSRVQSEYGHLGLRIRRSLFSHGGLLAQPNCDISIAELKVMLRGDVRGRSFRQTLSSALRVEIAPTVTSLVRWSARQGGPDQLSLFSTDEKRAPESPEQVLDLVRSLRTSLAMAERLLIHRPLPSAEWHAGQKTKKRRYQS